MVYVAGEDFLPIVLIPLVFTKFSEFVLVLSVSTSYDSPESDTAAFLERKKQTDFPL